jgi:hypothetical protein
MSYTTERLSIEKWFKDHYSLTPFGFDKHSFEPPRGQPSVRLNITSGESTRKTIGAPGANKTETVGVLQIMIYTPGGAGSVAWREIADTVVAVFRNARIGADGLALAPGSDDGAIIFGFYGDLPYVAGEQSDPPFDTVTLNAPFIRFGSNA